ncbi:hypothetical protein [Chamaesiphon minutus]|uniref:Uncharacterized protein n=1 Tax=Chamaesiphon minutus (strain ATCC 27169 / PCC 6605) TaxID=1173020 RepID=K9UEC7_CHAP6|nr:hypothetical protein [Chamaesiphon minutus]AFY92559.1 hypothetical protein Cha6605_1380 [Chamaesiphon minutus PCC 6605]
MSLSIYLPLHPQPRRSYFRFAVNRELQKMLNKMSPASSAANETMKKFATLKAAILYSE